MNTDQQKVFKYYSSLESRLGYDYILRGSIHLGYYPSRKADISEKEAQFFLQDLVAKNLELSDGQIVLDAGCGQGVVSTYLAKKYGPKVFGINIVLFQIKKARKLASRLGVQDKTDYQMMDYSFTNFPDNYFDAIYTTETLSHSPDIRKTLQEFFRVLKPGGKIAFFEYTIAPDEEFSEWEKKMLDTVIEGSAMIGLKDFRHDQFTKIIKEAGFEDIKEQDITENVLPSFYRLHKISILPYRFVKFFRLQKFFINTTAGFECYRMADKGLIRYCIFTGNKPT
ncbi:MAG: methyltransferase domain-containing protein [Patescibacteria group bacterium]